MTNTPNIQTIRYERNPLYVEAVQVTADNIAELSVWCQGQLIEAGETPEDSPHIKVRVHNPMHIRQTKAFVGDWLLYTERGYKVYTNKAFTALFTKVPDTEMIETGSEIDRQVLNQADKHDKMYKVDKDKDGNLVPVEKDKPSGTYL